MTQSVKWFFFQDKSVDVDSDDNKKEVRKMQDDDFRLPSGSSSEDESEIESESDEECESELAGTSEEEVVKKREGDFLMPVFKIDTNYPYFLLSFFIKLWHLGHESKDVIFSAKGK